MSGSSATPIQVLTRPFAVEPLTNVMLPDGIFDNAIVTLEISAHFTNQSTTALSNVTIYLEGVSDPGIAVNALTQSFPTIPAGASVMVQWSANFTNATPGKPLVSFIAQAAGLAARRSIQQIFVSQTRYNQATNSYTCTVGEGTLTASNITVIPSGANWGKTGGGNCCCGNGSTTPTQYGPFIPVGVTMVWTPGAPYAGVHGELPFADPWWKILGWIVFAIAALTAIIAAAVGHSAVNVTVGGTFDETGPSVQCCKPQSVNAGSQANTVAAVAGIVATVALAVALSDFEDPYYRGQTATPPADGELTTGEQVVAKWTLPDAPTAGAPYTADVEWTYQRFTTGATYAHSVSETQTNIHVAGDVEVITPSSVVPYNPLTAEAKFARSGGGGFFSSNQLYALVVFQAPNNGLYFVEDLRDDGLGIDVAANDGVYSASLNLEFARRLLIDAGQDIYGVWRVFVYAQDVNLTAPGTPPVIAAQTIGGVFVTSALTITFNPNLPCPLKAQSSIMVV